MKQQKYTLSLPIEIYEELKGQAEKRGTSIKDVLRQCLKFGLIAIKAEDDPNSEIIFRERVWIKQEDGKPIFETRDTRIKYVW